MDNNNDAKKYQKKMTLFMVAGLLVVVFFGGLIFLFPNLTNIWLFLMIVVGASLVGFGELFFRSYMHEVRKAEGKQTNINPVRPWRFFLMVVLIALVTLFTLLMR